MENGERKQAKILGFGVDLMSFSEALEFTMNRLRAGQGLQVVTINPEMIEIAKKEVRLEAQSDTESSVAIASLPDGVTDKYKVSVMLWDNVDEMYSFTGNKLTFDNKGR